MKERIKAFSRGWRHDFLSLEEALVHPEAERKLIDLQAPGVHYDPETKTVTSERTTENGGIYKETFNLNPQFHDYMDRYADKTHYITDNGTPWLTRNQEQGEIAPEQAEAYYEALSTGYNQDVVLLSWRKTNPRKKDSGHSALSVGSLNLAAGSTPDDETPIYEYEPEISGSFYPSTGPLFRPGKLLLQPIPGADKLPGIGKWTKNYRPNTDHHITAARDRHGQNSVAYSMGVTARDSVVPLSAAVGSMVGISVASKMVDMIRGKQKGEMTEKDINNSIRGIALMAAGYMAAKTAGALDMATGVVLLKEEERASGILASLVTPAQLDIMEHTLYGMYKTYHDKYNILANNCADFSDKMMDEIGLETGRILEEAMENEPEKEAPASRFSKALSVPQHIRPSRISYAFRNRKPISGEIDVDGQPLALSLVKVNNQSAVLIETEDFIFNSPPIETFQKALKEGLTLKETRQGQLQFDLQPHVKRIEPTRAASAAR